MRCGLLLLLCGTAFSAAVFDSATGSTVQDLSSKYMTKAQMMDELKTKALASTVVKDLSSTPEEPDESGLNLALLRFKARIQDSSLVATEVEELEGENAELLAKNAQMEAKNEEMQTKIDTLEQDEKAQDEKDEKNEKNEEKDKKAAAAAPPPTPPFRHRSAPTPQQQQP